MLILKVYLGATGLKEQVNEAQILRGPSDAVSSGSQKQSSTTELHPLKEATVNRYVSGKEVLK